MSVLQIAGNFFLQPIWLYAFVLLIPFILLYLIRPKPKHKVVPSLMFLFKDLGRDKKTNFFRKLIRDLLFLLQLFIILLLVISVAKPYVNVAKESLFKNTVLVLDVSASMKADYEGKTRFDEAVKQAKKNLGIVNTLVLAKKTPEVALNEESSGKIKEFLDRLEPTDTATNLYDAISTAGGYAKADSRIIVISDFIDTETDTGLDTAKKTLEAQGIKVDFLRIFEPVSNVGIIDLKIDEKKTTAVIKNYNPRVVDVELKVNSLEESMSIPADSRELFTFSTPAGTSKLELKVIGGGDGFEADNEAFVSAPSDADRNVLLITNNRNPKSTFLFNAFDVMKNTAIDVAIPPKIPDLERYHVYIFKDIDPNLILPGTLKSVKKEVETKGKTVIIAAQPNLKDINYYGLMPLRINDIIIDESNNPYNMDTSSSESLTANIEFGTTKKYFSASALDEKNILKIAAITKDNSPIVTFSTLGGGKVFYYGILDEDKEAEAYFAKSPVYFVFWKRLVDFATDTPSIKNLNFVTGSILNLKEEQRVQTPKGKITTKALSLDNAGLYTLNDRVIAINLVNEKESDVNNDASLDKEGSYQSSGKFKEKVPFELTEYLVIAAIILLLLEFLYIKMRGDL